MDSNSLLQLLQSAGTPSPSRSLPGSTSPNTPSAQPTLVDPSGNIKAASSSASNSLLSLLTNPPGPAVQETQHAEAMQKPLAFSLAPSMPSVPSGTSFLDTLTAARPVLASEDGQSASPNALIRPRSAAQSAGEQAAEHFPVPSTARSASSDLLTLLSNGLQRSRPSKPPASMSSVSAVNEASQAPPGLNSAASLAKNEGQVERRPSQPTMFDTFSPFDLLTRPAPPTGILTSQGESQTSFAEAPLHASSTPETPDARMGDPSSNISIPPRNGASTAARESPLASERDRLVRQPQVIGSPARTPHKLPQRPQSGSGSRPDTPRSTGGSSLHHSHSRQHSRNLQAGNASANSAPSHITSATASTPPRTFKTLRVNREKHAQTWLNKLRQSPKLAAESSSIDVSREGEASMTSIELDLDQPQPAGSSSIHSVKLEVTPVALLNAGTEIPFTTWQHPVSKSDLAAGQAATSVLHSSPSFYTPRIANLGRDIVVYPQNNKGKLRLIHVQTGFRALLSAQDADGIGKEQVIKGIWALEPHDASHSTSDPAQGWLLVAALKEPADEEFQVVWWHVHEKWGSEDLVAGVPELVTKGTRLAWENSLPGQHSGSENSTTGSSVKWVTVSSNELVLHCHTGCSTSTTLRYFLRRASDKEPLLRCSQETHSISLGATASPDGNVFVSIAGAHKHQAEELAVDFFVGNEPFGNDRSQGALRLPWRILGDGLSKSISHVQLIDGQGLSGQSSSTQDVFTQVLLLGFENNTQLSILRVDGNARRIDYQLVCNVIFLSNGGDQFNVLQYDRSSRLLLVGNTLRSSVFALPLLLDLADDRSKAIRLGALQEFPLPEPCISFTIVREELVDPSYRLFAMHPAGIHLVQLPSIRRGNKQRLKSIPASTQGSAATSSATSPMPFSDARENLATPDNSGAGNGTRLAPENGLSAGLRQRSEQLTSSSTVAPALAEVNVHAIQDAFISSINEHLRSALHDNLQVQAPGLAAQVSQVLASALPDVLARAMNRADTISRLTKVIQAAISAPVQQAAISAINQSLQHRFSEVMSDLAFRLEHHISAEMLQTRKDAIAEQSQALAQTEGTIGEIYRNMKGMQAQMDALRQSNADLQHDLRKSLQAQQGILEAVREATEALGQHQASNPPRTTAGPPQAEASNPVPAAKPFNVEDAFLAVLSDPNIQSDARRLQMLLQDLGLNFASPSAALASVSQPVLLALLHRLATCLWTFAQPDEPEQTTRGMRPAAAIPWLEAVAARIDKRDAQIAAAYQSIYPRLMNQLFEAHAALSRPGGKHSPWWTREQLIERITNRLIS